MYRGKPSSACAPCRKRRLKCDRRRPSCSQCVRMKKECVGYQDPKALRFFDQTSEVATKCQARATAENSTEVRSIICISPSIEDQAIAHTLKCYVGNTRSQSVLAYLPDLLRSDPTDALQATLKAIGLASISQIHNLPALRRAAGEEYSVALRGINRSLQDADTATSDSTLGTVVLLALYEMISCPESDMMHGWVNHVRGAIKLLELRGEKQLASAVGMELFTVVRLQSAVSNVFYRTKYHTSPWVLWLSKLAMSASDGSSNPVEAFYNILLPLNDLSIAIEEAYTRDGFTGDMAPLIRHAVWLDGALKSWALSLGSSWQYKTVHTEQSPPGDMPFPPHNDEYHIYPDQRAVTIWNHYRLTRLTLHELMQPIYWSLSMHQKTTWPDAQQTMAQSTAVSNEMVRDICASVPYFFRSDETRFAAGIRLPWPLFVAADSVSASPYTRAWICHVLDILGRSTGVQQALTMADSIKRGHHGMPLIPGKSQYV